LVEGIADGEETGLVREVEVAALDLRRWLP
jgi:hypothetical protein